MRVLPHVHLTMSSRFLWSALVLVLMWGRAFGQESYFPDIKAASEEGQEAMAFFTLPEGLEVDLWAAEPLLANPVSFAFDEVGRCYVVETFRLHAGVTDIRQHMDWLDDELATFTVRDRLAMMEKHEGEGLEGYNTEHDRIRLVTDTDGDGKADESVVFADGFHRPEDGLAAGVLSYRDNVWFTNIPDLWWLKDRDGDGRADVRRSLATGFGVRVTLLGHDLHGLRIGPDGKLYFSCGDRGLRVETPDGVLDYPEDGAVLRCDLDGSNLEVVHRGLRNPQELTFDDYGNLWTGDNNSDGRDEARWVWVVEGGDSGWRSPYQWQPDRGPWDREQLWKPHHPGQAGYIVPPIANLAHGPSGLTHYPGTGLGPEWNDHFFLADFRGAVASSGVLAFTVKPKGAFFTLGEVNPFIWKVLATDVDFGPDGAVYLSDWVQGWNMTGKGRIYRVHDPVYGVTEEVEQVRDLLARGLADQDIPSLAVLLGHQDRRVRQEAQFELVRRGDEGSAALAVAAHSDGRLLARLHGIWGLGMASRSHREVLDWLLPLTGDGETEVRTQSIKTLGALRYALAATHRASAAEDTDPRVRFHAGIAVGSLGVPAAVDRLVRWIQRVGEDDPYQRHGAVMGLLGSASPKQILSLGGHSSSHVRRAAVLVLRRLKDPALARFVADRNALVAREAAVAIYDEGIASALPALANELARHDPEDDPFIRRALAACLRLGGEERAREVAHYALNEQAPTSLRREALEILGDWAEPSSRDRVHNHWRPIEPHFGEDLTILVQDLLDGGLGEEDPDLVEAWIDFAQATEASAVAGQIAAWALDEEMDMPIRVASLEALPSFEAEEGSEAIFLSLNDVDGEIRAAALESLGDLAPEEALPRLPAIFETGEWMEQRAAYRILGEISGAEADGLLEAQVERLAADLVPAELALDLVLVAEERGDPILEAKLQERRVALGDPSPLTPYLDSQFGGRSDRGQEIFERTELSCVRCHSIDSKDRDLVGPDLSGVGSRLTRLQILESIVQPSRRTSPGFTTTNLFLKGGDLVMGRVLDETEKTVRVQDAEGEVVEIPVADIEERRVGLSAMPEDLVDRITREELRDLIAYVSGL